MFKDNSKSKTAKRSVLDAAATRLCLDGMLDKSFDPAMLEGCQLHPRETARFLAEQARKLRLAAIRAGYTNLVWMIETFYYEAYTMGCARQGLDRESDPRRN